MTVKKRNSILLLMLFGYLQQGFSQQFQNTAGLGTVERDSFYSIPVTPELSSYLKTDLSDVRIADEKGRWVPHIVNWSLKNTIVHNVYSALPVLKKENAGASLILIAENTGKVNLTNILLTIKNTAANRLAVISGSDDQKNWFTITDSILLSSAEMIQESMPAFRINLPPINYNYLKITIYNGNKDPFNILAILSEVPGDTRIKETYNTNPLLKFTQKDTTGFSLIHIENPAAYHLNKFIVAIASPKYYDRRVKLYLNAPGESIKDFIRASPFQEYIFSSGNTGEYETPLIKNKELYLLIKNGDNSPLQISSINTQQVRKELVAYLEKGKQYKLFFNDSLAVMPDYDLQHFRSKVPDSLPVLSIGKITFNTKTLLDSKEKTGNRKWLWPAIIIILLLLGYFTWSLTKDMKKGKK